MAHAITDYLQSGSQTGFEHVLLLCGPGENANIGLIAARHLRQTMEGLSPFIQGEVSTEGSLNSKRAEREGLSMHGMMLIFLPSLCCLYPAVTLGSLGPTQYVLMGLADSVGVSVRISTSSG